MKRIMINVHDDDFALLESIASERGLTVSGLCRDFVLVASKTCTPVNANSPCTQQIVTNLITSIRNYVKSLTPNSSFALADISAYANLPHGHKITVGKTWCDLVANGEPNVIRTKTKKGTNKYRGSAALYTRII